MRGSSIESLHGKDGDEILRSSANIAGTSRVTLSYGLALGDSNASV